MRFIILLAFILCAIMVYSQDKIIKKSGVEIMCEVCEVGDDEIKYYYPEKPKVVFEMDNRVVSSIEFATGEVIKFQKNKYAKLKFTDDQHTHALKLNILSLLMGSTEFVYEQNVKAGRSWETSLGLIGLGFDNLDINPTGVYGKFAYKFIRIPDYYNNKMHYAHVLKGLYLAPEFIIRYVAYDANNYYNYGYPQDYRSDDFGIAMMFKLGSQWVFNDSFLVDVFLGVGFSSTTNENSDLTYGFASAGIIAVNGGLRVGWTF